MLRLLSKPFSLVVLSGVVAAGPIWWHFYRPSPAAVVARATTSDGESQPNTDLEVALIRAGIDAKTLTAAGVTSGSVSSLGQAASQHFNAHPTVLSSADTAYASARRESDRLQRLIQSGKGTQDDVAAYQAQKAALETATAQQTAALDALFEATTASLNDSKRGVLSKIRTNKSWSLPTEYLTVDRTQQEWVNVRDALANERISAAYGDQPDAALQAQLATWRADATVAAAQTALSTNLASVTAALSTALSTPSDH